MLRLGAILVAVAILTAATPIQAAPSQKTPGANSHQNANQDQRGTDKLPIVVKVIESKKSKNELDREDAAQKEKTASDGALVTLTGNLALYTKLLAIGTFLLFLATGGLVRIGYLQVRDAKQTIAATKIAADAAKKSADVARDTLHAQRAVVATDGPNGNVMFGDGGVILGYHFEAIWTNSGGTTALGGAAGMIYKLIDGQQVDSVVFDRPPISQRDNITVAPQRHFRSTTQIPINDLSRVFRGEARLFLLTRIEYTDVFNFPHHTQGCSEVRIVNDPSRPVAWDVDKPVVGAVEKRLPSCIFSIWREHNSSS